MAKFKAGDKVKFSGVDGTMGGNDHPLKGLTGTVAFVGKPGHGFYGAIVSLDLEQAAAAWAKAGIGTVKQTKAEWADNEFIKGDKVELNTFLEEIELVKGK